MEKRSKILEREKIVIQQFIQTLNTKVMLRKISKELFIEFLKITFFSVLFSVLSISTSAQLEQVEGLVWERIPDYAIDIDISKQGTVWKIGRNRNVLFKWNQNKQDWESQSDRRNNFKTLAASRTSNDIVLLLDKNKNIYTYVPYPANVWNKLPGKAIDVAMDYDGGVFIADRKGKVCKWNAQKRSWQEVGRSPSNIEKIAVVPKGFIYAINDERKVYKFIDGRWELWESDIKDINIGAPGRVWMLDTDADLLTFSGRINKYPELSDPKQEAIVAIASDEFGLPWVVTFKGKIFRGLPKDNQALMSDRKSAVVVIASIEDGNFRRLLQNAHNRYGQCFKGYDHSVLMKNAYSSPIQPDIHHSNPSARNLFQKLRSLADRGYYIDLYIISHGSPNKIRLEHGTITPEMIRNQLGKGKYANGKFPLRMVYQMNCWGADLNQAFIDVGANVTCGSRQVNFYPNQFNAFVEYWNDGLPFKEALKKADTQDSRSFFHALIKVHANTQDCFSPKCKFGRTVLGNDSKNCAMRYLENCWNIQRRKCRGDNGIEMMNHSSKMIVMGDNINKYSRPVW